MTTTQVAARAQTATLSTTVDELINFRTVQTITLASADAGDYFDMQYQNSAVTRYTVGTNMTAAAMQAALRTATGDASLTVAGTTDAGPFTVTFVALLGFRELLNISNQTGMTAVATSVDPNHARTARVVNQDAATWLYFNINSATVPTSAADDTYAVGPGTSVIASPGGEIYTIRVVGNGNKYDAEVY